MAVSEKHNTLFVGSRSNSDIHTFTFDGTHYSYDNTDTLPGSETTDILYDEDSEYHVHNIQGLGAFISRYVSGVLTYKYTQFNPCPFGENVKAALSQNILALGCDDGNVFVYELG